MRDVVIVSAVRTPIGTYGGSFKDISAVQLGTTVVKEAMKRANLDPNMVDELIFGNILSAGLGQNVARQVAVHAGLPNEMPSFTINKVCGSGLKAVELAAQAIRAGDADVIIAGGTENMSQAAYVMPNYRWGQRMGDGQIIDTMIYDGLTDAFQGYHMGITAENIVAEYGITREDQDELAARSQNRAAAAIESGRFNEEIVPVEIPQRKGDPILMEKDEYPRQGVTAEGLAKLKPAFKKDGSVTAGNASGINDGAAALVVMSKEKAEELGIAPLAEIKAYASGGVDPSIMGTGPIAAVKSALKKAGLTVEDIDLIESNEAFAAQALAVSRELGFDPEKTNVNGGAIALGHPIGASGARILVTLLHEMEKQDAKLGLATLCIGGGQGTALVVERKEK